MTRAGPSIGCSVVAFVSCACTQCWTRQPGAGARRTVREAGERRWGQGGIEAVNPEPIEDEISLSELWELFVRGLFFVVPVVLVAALLTFVLVRHAPRVYQATSTILASQPDAGLKSFNVSLVTAPPANVAAYEAAAKGFPTLKRALESLGIPSPTRTQVDALRQKLSLSANQSSGPSVILLNVRDKNPSRAAAEANAIASSLLAWDKDRASSHLQTIVKTLRGQIKALNAQITADRTGAANAASDISGLQQLKAQQTLQLNAAQALSNSAVGLLEVITPAQAPLKPVGPRPKLAAAIAAVLAFIAGYLIVLLRSALDSKYRSVEDLGRDLELNVLAVFPSLGPKAGLLPRERVNFLRTNLSFATAAAHPKVYLVTSADSGDGKTTLAVNLAEAYARNEYRTLLIDADLRKPDVGRMLGVEAEGSWDLLALLKDPSLHISLRTIDVDGASFEVLPTKLESSRATELLSKAFKTVLGRINDFDVIVIDSAPLLAVADSLVVAPHVTSVVLASNLVETDKRRIRSAVGLLERLGVQVAGLAVTHVSESGGKRRGSGYGYGESYGYGYGYASKTEREHRKGFGRTGMRVLSRLPRRSVNRSESQNPSATDDLS